MVAWDLCKVFVTVRFCYPPPYNFLRNKMRARTNSTFKLSKRAKTMIALMSFKNDQDRHGFKNAMIDAQVAANIVPRTAKERDAK